VVAVSAPVVGYWRRQPVAHGVRVQQTVLTRLPPVMGWRASVGAAAPVGQAVGPDWHGLLAGPAALREIEYYSSDLCCVHSLLS
jgi:hypothetical protein